MNELQREALRGLVVKMQEWVVEAEILVLAGDTETGNLYFRSVKEAAFTACDIENIHDTVLLECYASWGVWK